jgi:hypothetical protein
MWQIGAKLHFLASEEKIPSITQMLSSVAFGLKPSADHVVQSFWLLMRTVAGLREALIEHK